MNSAEFNRGYQNGYSDYVNGNGDASQHFMAGQQSHDYERGYCTGFDEARNDRFAEDVIHDPDPDD